MAANVVTEIGRNNFRNAICSCDREERKLYLLYGGTISAAIGRNKLAVEYLHAIGRNNFRSGICSCDREERKLYLL